jgi:hypothetical protein
VICRFPVEIVPVNPEGGITHALRSCPRCGANIGISESMYRGVDSIICRGRRGEGGVCNGHFYLREGRLEFVGTI